MARTKLPAQLLRYWSKGGPGGAKINWGTPGDFGRCTTLIGKEAAEDGKPMPDSMVRGLCANLHKINTGETPGNAPGEKRKR